MGSRPSRSWPWFREWSRYRWMAAVRQRALRCRTPPGPCRASPSTVDGKTQGEFAAAAGALARGRERPAVQLGQAARQRQPDAEAFAVTAIRLRPADEEIEEARHRLRVD